MGNLACKDRDVPSVWTVAVDHICICCPCFPSFFAMCHNLAIGTRWNSTAIKWNDAVGSRILWGELIFADKYKELQLGLWVNEIDKWSVRDAQPWLPVRETPHSPLLEFWDVWLRLAAFASRLPIKGTESAI